MESNTKQVKKIRMNFTTSTKPTGTKLFVPRHVTPQCTRVKLSQSLFSHQADFNLQDPEMRIMGTTYNQLHDPYLKEYFKHPFRRKTLLKHRLIDENDDVLCSVKEFNSYMTFLHHYGWDEEDVKDETKDQEDVMKEKKDQEDVMKEEKDQEDVMKEEKDQEDVKDEEKSF